MPTIYTTPYYVGDDDRTYYRHHKTYAQAAYCLKHQGMGGIMSLCRKPTATKQEVSDEEYGILFPADWKPWTNIRFTNGGYKQPKTTYWTTDGEITKKQFKSKRY
jgi:hypothetical protein